MIKLTWQAEKSFASLEEPNQYKPTDIQPMECARKIIDDITEEERRITSNVTMLMTLSERVYLHRLMRSGKSYFEYGCGGSTILACQVPNILKITTVESNLAFLNELLNSSPCLVDSYLNKRVEAVYADIGPISEFGIPSDFTRINNWPSYPEAVLLSQNYHTEARPDLVLVDGRFRVASALNALLVLDPPTETSRGGILAIHDFFTRPGYYIVLEYAEVVDCIENMILLRRKSNLDWTLFMRDLKKYSYIYH